MTAPKVSFKWEFFTSKKQFLLQKRTRFGASSFRTRVGIRKPEPFGFWTN
jgi:hypothetical protein